MSKVIKYAVIKDPLTIEAPVSPSLPEDEDDRGPGYDEEAVAKVMAEIKAKEERAQELMDKANAKAESLRRETETECDRLLAEAKAQAEELKEEARKEGHEEGLKQGQEEGESKVRQEMAEILNEANAQAEKTLKDAQMATFDYVQQAEQDIIRIVLGIVEKILPQHFLDVPQTVLPLVKEAIMKVREQKQIIVHVPPASYDLVLLARDELRTVLTAGDAVLEIHSDEALKPGDCLVETPNGSVDARLATQMQLVEQAVREVML